MLHFKLNNILINASFVRSETNSCVYRREEIVVALYVDDFLIFYEKNDQLTKLRELIHSHFNMKDIGVATSCLGINIKQGMDFIEIDQSHYVKQILERFGMQNCKPVSTPSDLNQKLSIQMWNEENSLVGRVPYQEIIGSLGGICGSALI